MSQDQVIEFAKQAMREVCLAHEVEPPDDVEMQSLFGDEPTVELLKLMYSKARRAALDEAINACKEYALLPRVDSGVPLAIANRIGMLK